MGINFIGGEGERISVRISWRKKKEEEEEEEE